MAEAKGVGWEYDGVVLGTASSVLDEGSFASGRAALEVVRVDRIYWQVEQAVALGSVYLPIVDSSPVQSHLKLARCRVVLRLVLKVRPTGVREEHLHLQLGIAEDARLVVRVHFVDWASR